MIEKVVWKFQKHAHFGFIIPDNREEYGWDFFVSEKNCRDAKDWEKVVWHILSKSKWKKPEAKVVEVWKPKPKKPKNITWIYSEHKGLFWFVDVEDDKWYFVFKRDNSWAKDGDKVEARVKIFKEREEATITKILKDDTPLIVWVYSDAWGFWFVKPEKWTYTSDIFIAWAKKLEAKDGDTVWVQVIKTSGRRPEGVVREIIEKKES